MGQINVGCSPVFDSALPVWEAGEVMTNTNDNSGIAAAAGVGLKDSTKEKTMKTNIAAFTSTGIEYPEYISINRTKNGLFSITIRGAKKLDADRGYNVSGDVAEITMKREDLIGLLHEAHDNLFGDEQP